MPSSNRYPKSNPGRGDFRPPQPTRRPLKPYRPTRPFQWTPPIKEPGKFPGLPRPSKPFGTRIPLPGTLAPVLPRVAFPLGRLALRMVPWLGWGLLVWDLYNLYQQWNPPSGTDCNPPNGNPEYYRWLPNVACGFLYGSADSFSREWSVGNPYLGHRQELFEDPAWYGYLQAIDWSGPYEENPGFPTMPEVGVPGGSPVYIPPPQSPVPILPWVPIAVPVFAPQPIPLPRPRWVPLLPNPEQAPGPDPWNPEKPLPEEENRPGTVRPGSPSANAAPGGLVRPSPYPEPTPSPGPRPQPNPFPARKPGRGVKERKLKGTAGQRKVMGLLLSGASEGFDLLDALHEALPKKLQGKDHPKAKFEALYRHWDKVNMDEAFANIWKNQVEDRYYGEQFQKMQDAFSELGLDFPSLKNIFGNWSQFV